MFLLNNHVDVTFLLFLWLFGIGSSSASIYNANYCPNNTSYNSNLTFETNLKVLLASMVSNVSLSDGYYFTAMGMGTTSVANGLLLCRGDVSTATCHDCISTAATEITRRCPNKTESIIWYDECMLRFTNRYFAPTSVVPRANLMDGNNISASDLDSFNRTLFGLLNDLIEEAANSRLARKFATGQREFAGHSPENTVYALTECEPDLTTTQCEECLRNAVSTLPSCCGGKQGARALLSYCNARHELFRFYHTSDTSGNKKSVSRVVLIVVPVVVSIILLLCVCYFILKRSRKKYNTLLRENFGEESATLESLQFGLVTIEAATNKFSYEKRIGEGGFGVVYKGVLPDGREIAVKKLSKSSGQDSHRSKQLNWSERYKIIEGIAQGISYLHEHSRLKVIHRDLKPSNVLLDSNMNPKISDFGMARIVAIDQLQGKTNRIVGTYGYMSPEYAMHGQFSEKSDVFSFGVIVLEIISAKRNTRSVFSDHDDLLSYTWEQWMDEAPLNIFDQSIKAEFCDHSEVVKCIQIGLLCVQEKPDDRPKITQVISYLNSSITELPLPKKPINSRQSGIVQKIAVGESSSGSTPSINEMSESNFRKAILCDYSPIKSKHR
ncbi:cysteine-rich receptor-like protein kinase 25 isoform X3 [Glycine soja]|uniref:cysteine-rich receptor-like protein kinase 25 isoform X3 n=1 Tax=Glycine soja TaxID=3848 RepID=UPI00103DDA48|nr:cysteine-rich receptor-like protein kinase 25 isoform X3 [Glycine soja]